MNIYESAEDYLERILMLNNEGKKVKSIDLARSFDYSRASISRAINNLADEGFIDIINGYLILTEKGKSIASKMLERHIVLSDFFVSLGVEKNQALEDACKSIVDCPHSTPSYTSEDTGFMCIRTSIVKKNRIMWEDIEYIPEEEYIQRIQRKKPEKGDVVYTREGAILGIAAVIDRDCNVALGQRSMLLSPDRTFCTPEFISVAMNFDSFLDNALKGMSGSASPHINVGDIKAFKMILPPIKQQEAFSAFVTQVDKSRFVIQKALDEAQLLFDSLMQEYFE